MIAFVFALQLLAGSSAATAPKHAAAPVATAPAGPLMVQLTGIAGLPADSLVRAQFLAGFHAAFAERTLPTEGTDAARGTDAAATLPNRFRELDGEPTDDTWTLAVVVGSPPAAVLPHKGDQQGHRVLETRRRSRGMIAAFDVQAPDPGGGAPPPAHDRVAFAFPAAAGQGAGADSIGALSVPAIGYVFPWSDAGRAVARLALEVLHHELGDLPPEAHVAIAPAFRAGAGR